MAQLNVQKRTETGTLRMRRMRNAGKIPGVIYGHGEGSIPITIDARDIHSAIRQGAHMVTLNGELTDSALIKDVQWDAFGTEVLHMDLTRVDVNESVEVTLQVELVGTAPGSRAGGIVRHSLHQLDIACPANAIPEKLEARINDLELGDSITAGEIELPEGATLVGEADAIVVQCVEETASADDEGEGDAGPAEPEVIGRKDDAEESGE